jgi:hypothetical protein
LHDSASWINKLIVSSVILFLEKSNRKSFHLCENEENRFESDLNREDMWVEFMDV